MKIETAKEILRKYLDVGRMSAAKAQMVLDKYHRGEIVFSPDQHTELLIYKSLGIIACSEMDRQHRADCKRAQREAAKRKEHKRNNGWRS